ncbi:hypothetical protein AS156_07505 [Bradyrhizobium macuxiense]|uniref:Uncharacterized protein n=1 Tax=Bradyrhizobium macuxiense TaxID=1755647 RepID=A0A109JS19_9BRAD|nr:hypothetical protein [Bradyrhizobium macuxiense]KWV54071.1 hypothetical protein AS156_07505 [Bradyrhizobium macuxiense]
MRKLILISAVTLASAQAGQSRGLVLAVNDTPAAAAAATAPATQPPQAPQPPQATQAQPDQAPPVQTRAAQIPDGEADLLLPPGERRGEGAPDRRALRHLLVAAMPS